MQVHCPQCATRILVDDGKVPDRPFKIRCPKCQTLLGLPGRGASASPAPVPTEPAAQPEPAPEPAIEIPSTEMLERQERLGESHKDALVVLEGPAAAPVQQALARLGFNVDAVDKIEEGGRLLEQGVYDVAVTSRSAAPAGKTETLAQRILRMPSETRRGVFVVLVGEEFRTGDGTQAWAAQADLVLNPAEAPRCENLFRALMVERRRLYQPFVEARKKIEGD